MSLPCDRPHRCQCHSGRIGSWAVNMRVVATEFGRPAGAVLRRLVAEAKHDDPLAPVTVMVASNYVGVSVRRTLARQQITSVGIGITGIDLVTTYRLAELIAAPILAAQQRRPVSNPVVAAAIRQVLGAGGSMFEPVRDHPSTERQLLRVHRELRDLNPSQLDVLAAQSDRAAEVVRIHRQTTSLLAEAWYDEFDLFAEASQIISTQPEQITRRGRIIVYLPKVVSAAATQMLTSASAHTEVVVVVGVTGDHRADASARRLCSQLGVSLPDRPITPPTGTRIVSVSDADDEVRTVIRHVLDALVEGDPLEQMAIVHASDEPYARLLAEQLEAAAIPHNGAAVQQLGHSVVGRTLKALLALGDNRYSRADVMSVLSSAPIRQLPGRPGLTPTTEWERLSRRAGVTRSHEEWSRRLLRVRIDAEDDLAGVDEHDDRPERQHRRRQAERTARSAAELSLFVDELVERTAPSAVPSSWADKCAWARGLIDRYLGPPDEDWPSAEVEAADRVAAALDRLAGLGAVEAQPTLATFRRSLDVELESGLGRTGSFGDGVFVGHPGQLAGLELQRVFVLGMAEGVFPARRRDDSLLPDRERDAVGDTLASVAGRADDDHRDLLSALAAAPHHRTLYFPRGDLRRSAERVPSRWLLDTATALSGTRVWSDSFSELAANEWAVEVPSFLAGVRDASFPATDQEFEAQRLLQLRGERQLTMTGLVADELVQRDPAFRYGIELIEARRSSRFTRFDGNLTHLAGGIDVGQAVVSPTRLESWAFCPHQYLMRHVLGIEALDRPDEARRINALDRGSLIHNVLDEFINGELRDHGVPGVGQAWSAQARDRLAEIVHRQCDLTESRGLVGKQLFWLRDRRAIVNDVMTLLDKDRARDAAGTVLAAELTFGLGDAAPVTYQLSDGREVRFRGSADRLEVEPDGRLGVIDYKTGSTYSYRDIDRRGGDKLVNGTKLQLPVYALAARRAHGSPDSVVRAYYWFITRKGGYKTVGYEVDDAIMERFDEVLTTVLDGLEAGIFVARPAAASYEFFVSCEYCDPDHLGTSSRRREWERKRHDPALASYLALAEPEAVLHTADEDPAS